MKKRYNLLNKKKALVGIKSLAFMLVFMATVLFAGTTDTKAKILDEILDYSIFADVNEDASVDLTYNISWKVLDSTSEGPLEWVQIGIPNNHYNEVVGLSDNISSISTKSSGGTYAVIYFDRKYYEGEVVDFSFRVNQGYMYQVYPEEGVAEYKFTPGWFDSAPVDNLEIYWNSDRAIKIEPASLNEGDYYHWQASLNPGEKFSVEITYPTDAFAFDLSQHNNDDDGYNFEEHSAIANFFYIVAIIIGVIFVFAFIALPVAGPALIVYFIYKAATGFKVAKEKKITRTIVEYYDSCPNCGGSREEGKEKCSYCGTNMVKSKQEIKEEDVKVEDKKILDFTSNGEYRYSSNPNRYVRVNVISVPHVVYTKPSPSSSRSRSSFSSSGRSHHSSCAHSSCACACACACAGGGRAGCTTKDFYNTDMKLEYLEKICKKK